MMPHSQYIPGHEPPSMWDRVLAHAFSVPLNAFATLLGALIIISAFNGIEVSRSLAESPGWLKLVIGLPLIAGGPLSLYGTLNPGRRISRLRAMSVETIGNIPLASGCYAFGLGVLSTGNDYAVVTIGFTLGIGTGYLLRTVALIVSEKRVRARIEAEQHIGE